MNRVLCHHVSEFGGLWLVVTPTWDFPKGRSDSMMNS